MNPISSRRKADQFTCSRAELSARIEPALFRRIEQDRQEFRVRRVEPRLTWNRFDLPVKLFYLESLCRIRSEFAERVYDEHIKAFTLGRFEEPGNDQKTELAHFKQEFEEILKTTQLNGFDPELSFIPLARDGSILNGAHRCAAAIFAGKPTYQVETGLEPFRFDYRYFRNRGMPGALLDATAIKYVEWSPDAMVALLWPTAPDDKHPEDILGPLVYKKAVRLTTNGAHNLLSQVYRGDSWLGDPAQNYPGISHKLLECFGGPRPLQVLVFDSATDRDLLETKQQIRNLFEFGKHSIHIPDTHEKAVEICRLLLNPQSVHFLDKACPTQFPGVAEKAEAFRVYLDRNGVSPEDVAIDSGFVLGAYGLREPHDIDFVSAVPVESEGDFSVHTPDRHQVPVGDLLHDPSKHFHYWGLKLISVDQIAAMKRRRRKAKDLEDLRLLLPHQRGGRWVQKFQATGYRFRFLVVRLRRRVVRLLGRFGLADPARTLYRRLFRNR